MTRTLATSGLMVLAVAILLASLSFVTWRQSRALEGLARLEELRQDRSVARARIAELDRRVQYLESRARVLTAARERLGMHQAGTDEMVNLPGGTR